MRAPFIAAGVAALALAGWALSPRGERAQKAPATATAHHEDADEKLRALNDKIASLQRAMADRPAEEASRRAEAPAPEDPGKARDDAPRPPRRTEDEVFTGLEKRLRREGKDPSWSAQAEAKIADAFHGEALAGSTMLGTTCGTTFCRVDVSHDSVAVRKSFLQGVRFVPPFDQGGTARPVDDPETGARKTVVYVARDGHSLPSGDDG